MGNRLANHAETSEHKLVRDVARGDEGAVDELFKLYGDRVLRFVYRRVGEQFEDAQEITGDTFVSALGLAASFNFKSSVITWLCGIAKLRIVDFYRRRDRGKRVPASMTETLEDMGAWATGMEQILDRIEARQVVDALLVTLSEDEREAMLLRYAEGLSLREAAAMMNRSERGVDSLLTRAKHKARTAMEQWLPGGER